MCFPKHLQAETIPLELQYNERRFIRSMTESSLRVLALRSDRLTVAISPRSIAVFSLFITCIIMTALVAGVLSILHLVVIGMLYLPLRLIATGIKSRAKVSGCLTPFKSQRFMFIRFGCAFLGGRCNRMSSMGPTTWAEHRSRHRECFDIRIGK